MNVVGARARAIEPNSPWQARGQRRAASATAAAIAIRSAKVDEATASASAVLLGILPTGVKYARNLLPTYLGDLPVRWACDLTSNPPDICAPFERSHV